MRVILTLLLFCIPGLAQEQNNWDQSLDRYELICERCLELRRQEQSGHRISQESLSSLMVQLTMLRSSLSAAQGKMSAAQKARFEMIRRRLGQNSEPEPPEVPTAIPAKLPSSAARSEVAKLDPAPSEERKPFPGIRILESPVPDVALLQSEVRPLQFPVSQGFINPEPLEEMPRAITYLVAVQLGAFPDFSGGLMLGAAFSGLGVYASGRSSFSKKVAAAYSCDSAGEIIASGGVSPGRIWADGRRLVSRNVVSAGIYAFPGRLLSPYAGLGYGMRRYLVGDTDGRWACVKDCSVSGMNLDFGLMLRTGRFVAGIGVDYTLPSFADFTLSLGFSF